MDINNSRLTNQGASMQENAGAVFGYDMEAEKQRITAGTEEIKKELTEKFNKKYAGAQIFPTPIASMHPEVIDFLLSFNLVSVYNNIARQAGLDAKGRSVLPKIVWQIAQSKKWDDLDQILETNLPLVHSAHVNVVNLLKQNILDEIQNLSEKPVQQKIVNGEEVIKKEIQLSLADALSQYLKIGEQNITNSQLSLRAFPTPVRPSIKNWISDFHDVMGAGKHSPIDRGNFLFHSENGKKLSSTERQKVATILRSLDEGTLLTIDGDAQIVVFANLEIAVEQKSANISNANRMNAQAPLPSGDHASINTQARSQDFNSRVSGSFDQVKERLESENSFQLPQSKPPIGSSEFDVEKMRSIIDARNAGSRDFAIASEPEYSFGGENSQTIQKNPSQNFVSDGVNVSFSSPQKFPAEQNKNVNQFQPSQNQQDPKVQKNIVDLRN